MILRPFDPCDAIRISADVQRKGERLTFIYELTGGTADVVFPPPAEPARTDDLWQATCFEAFIAVGKSSYIELNFSPSSQWAAHRFTNYRQGMRELDIGTPDITFAGNRLVANAKLPAPPGAPLGITAVIEHRSGVRTYWALAHPGGNRPDFHARDCFIARLP